MAALAYHSGARILQDVKAGCRNFELYFQPQVAGDDQHLVGAETLLRWKNNKGRMVAPMEFIRILEETKTIVPVGRWIFEQALRVCKEWRKQIPNFCMSINMSYEQIKDYRSLSLWRTACGGTICRRMQWCSS